MNQERDCGLALEMKWPAFHADERDQRKAGETKNDSSIQSTMTQRDCALSGAS
jgi:hypothetical protein